MSESTIDAWRAACQDQSDLLKRASAHAKQLELRLEAASASHQADTAALKAEIARLTARLDEVAHSMGTVPREDHERALGKIAKAGSQADCDEAVRRGATEGRRGVGSTGSTKRRAQRPACHA